MKRGDIVDVKYPHTVWQTVGIITKVWPGAALVQVMLLWPKENNYVVGSFMERELELLGHIELPPE